MQALLVILYVCGAIGYLSLLFFVFHLYRKLKANHEMFFVACKTIAKIYLKVSILQLEKTFDQLSNMKKAVVKLTEEERFEDAAQLKRAIDKLEKDASAMLADFKETFGAENVSMTEIHL